MTRELPPPAWLLLMAPQTVLLLGLAPPLNIAVAATAPRAPREREGEGEADELEATRSRRIAAR